MLGQGTFDPESIDKPLMGWVNGDKVKDIAKRIKQTGQSNAAFTKDINNDIICRNKISVMAKGVFNVGGMKRGAE